MITAGLSHDAGALPVVASGLISQDAGFVHGFTTRVGGVSTGSFRSLNLGLKWGDEADAVKENRRRLLAASGLRVIHWARQVHGAAVHVVRDGQDHMALATTAGDALCSNVPGVGVGVYVADCTPVLLADLRTGAVGAAHAGWRGTVAGVVPALVRTMVDAFGTRPADLRVAMGPAIGPCCFEVGPEVVAAFDTALPDGRAAGVVVETRGSKAHIDLKRANALQLQQAGVPARAIDAGGECTACGIERFFSYRRDGSQTGQHVGFIGRCA